MRRRTGAQAGFGPAPAGDVEFAIPSCYDAPALADSPYIDGFEVLEQGPHTVLIRPDWKPWLLGDLVEDFRRVEWSERRAYPHGRVTHFSYLPSGAPARVFVRKARRGGLIGLLMRGLYLGGARPVRELKAAAAARKAGLAVPEPLAVRTTRAAGIFRRFTIVTREIEGASNLLALAPGLPGPGKRRLIDQVADEMRRLHEAGIYHADLTLQNILSAGGAVHFIDLDKALLRPRREEALDLMNLSRLNRSVEKLFGSRGCVSRADRLRFLRRYLGGPEAARGRLKKAARACASGLWFHRLWWLLSRQA